MINKNVVYKVERYNAKYYALWNNFLEQAKNATFLFHRDFMEYHKDRFDDFSLMVFKDDCLTAVLPANIKGSTVYSHQGLSYGGLLLSKKIKTSVALESFNALLKYLHLHEVTYLTVKPIPSIYTIVPSDELDYFMFVLKAELLKKETLSVIAMNDKLSIPRNRMEGVKRAKKHNLVFKEDSSFEVFWSEILVKNLKDRYGVSPVHSFLEIEKLKQIFPNNIKLFTAYKGDKMVAGTVIFESKYVAHSQYISADDDRNTLGSLDFLHYHLINNVYKDKQFFDFGSSNIDDGKHINKGLQAWKEGFGARTITQNFYKVEVKNYNLLETVLS